MKVIIRGTPPSEKQYTGKCHICSSVLMYQRSEVSKITSDQRDGDSHILEDECPVCGKYPVCIYSPTLANPTGTYHLYSNSDQNPY